MEEAKKKILEGLRNADIVKVNDTELKFITGKKDLIDGANLILQKGPETVVVTQGEKGGFFYNKEGFEFFPAYRVKVVDTVGCGDAFTAAMIYQLLFLNKKGKNILSLNKKEMKDILRFANAAGALTATKKGVIPSLPTKKQIEQFLL